MNMEKLPKHLQRDLRRLILYVYRAHRQTPPPGTTIQIGYTDSRPECSWANIIELYQGWTLRYSVNTVDRTIKVKPTDVYVALGTTEFDTLMEEVTEYVHNSESEQEYYEDYEDYGLSADHFQPAVRVRQPVADSKVQATTCVVKVEEEIDLTGTFQAPHKKVKLEQGVVPAVKQECNKVPQQPPAAMCACGTHVIACSAPDCSTSYCKPCDRKLKEATDQFVGFQTCSWFCCRGRTAYCEGHRKLLSRCSACNELMCKQPQCDACKEVICMHCLDDHEEKACSARRQTSSRVGLVVR